MMNQETFVNIKDLREQGWTIKEIAAGTGFHPATVSKYLKQGPPPARREAPDSARVMNARWCERVRSLIEAHPKLLGISVLRCLQAEGFEGGYSTVTRELRRIREEIAALEAQGVALRVVVEHDVLVVVTSASTAAVVAPVPAPTSTTRSRRPSGRRETARPTAAATIRFSARPIPESR